MHCTGAGEHLLFLLLETVDGIGEEGLDVYYGWLIHLGGGPVYYFGLDENSLGWSSLEDENSVLMRRCLLLLQWKRK